MFFLCTFHFSCLICSSFSFICRRLKASFVWTLQHMCHFYQSIENVITGSMLNWQKMVPEWWWLYIVQISCHMSLVWWTQTHSGRYNWDHSLFLFGINQIPINFLFISVFEWKNKRNKILHRVWWFELAVPDDILSRMINAYIYIYIYKIAQAWCLAIIIYYNGFNQLAYSQRNKNKKLKSGKRYCIAMIIQWINTCIQCMSLRVSLYNIW